jgi:predicted dehydrogenase
MSDPIRWGILGAASFARRHMGPAIHEADHAILAAIATRDPVRAEPFAAFSPGIAVMDSYDALLEMPGIDAVYIPLPNHLHAEWTLKALKAGKHVLCEKPLGMEVAEIDQIIAARDAAGRLAAEAFMIVHHPQWHLTQALLRDGAIGRLAHVQSTFTFDNRGDVENIRNRAETGGGALRDIGIYPVGATRFATGLEPEAIEARAEWENGIDATAHVRGRFGDATFAMMVSMRMHPRQEIVFHGEKGVLRLSAPFNAGVASEAQVQLARVGHPEELWRFTIDRQYRLQVEAFGRAVADRSPFACPLEFSRGSQVALDATLGAALGTADS